MKKHKDIFAELVSRLLDPVWEIPLAILLAVAFAAAEGLRWRFLGLLLFVDAVVPFIFFLTMLRHKQLVNWDMQRRGERIPIYAFALICHLAGLWLAHELGLINLFYGWHFIWLYCLLAFVMWARVYQRHHTWEQVIVGAILGGGMVLVGLNLVL